MKRLINDEWRRWHLGEAGRDGWMNRGVEGGRDGLGRRRGRSDRSSKSDREKKNFVVQMK